MRTVRALTAVVGLVLIAAAPACAKPDAGDETPQYPEGRPFDPEILGAVHEIRDRAARMRGLEVNPAVSEEAIAPVLWDLHVESSCVETSTQDLRENEAWTLAWALLGAIGEGEPVHTGSCALDAGWAGFYLFEEDRLVLIGHPTRLEEGNEITLAHEYVHSFQDALIDWNSWDDLQRREIDENGPTEYVTTLRCLSEGDATVAEVVYDEESAAWPSYYTDYWNSFGHEVFADVPGWDWRYERFHYEQCALMVEHVYREGGWDAVNALYDDPPATTEQVLHPEKLASREPPLDVPLVDFGASLSGDWEHMDSAVFGEFDVWNLIGTATGDGALASQASAGWGGGRITMYRLRGAGRPQVMVHLSLRWDSEADAAEFIVAAGELAPFKGRPQSTDGGIAWSGTDVHGQLLRDGTQVDVVVGSLEEQVREAAAALRDPSGLVAPADADGGEERTSLPPFFSWIGGVVVLVLIGGAVWLKTGR